jgi:hypothetical protein
MALTVFPRAIPIFQKHRNLLDDVDAEHINAIQRELTAAATVIGPNPHIYNDINLPLVTTTATPSDEGGIDPDTTYTADYRHFDPTVQPRDHGTISNRLDYIERGRAHLAFKLKASTIDIAPKDTPLSERPRGIRFPKPNDSNDPNSLFNSVGVTLRKSGFWVFHGSVAYNLLGDPNSKNEGVYQATIDASESWVEGMVRWVITSEFNNTSPVLNPALTGFFPRGTRITLRTSHNSDVTQRIRLARLGGFLLRETV